MFAITIHKMCRRLFWIWIKICVKIFYPHNLVYFALRDMRYTSMKSCDQGLHFDYLQIRPLNKLWGRYDPKTENMTSFFVCNYVISSHRAK